MIKKTLAVAALAATLSLGALSGCVVQKPLKSITSIECTGHDGLKDIYTITYTDGSQSFFTVTNGKDGADGTSIKEITLEDVFETYKSVYGDISFDEFCKKYFSTAEGGVQSESGNLQALNQAFLSCGKVYMLYNNDAEMVSGSSVIYKMDEEYTYMLTNYHVTYGNGGSISGAYAYMYGSEYRPVKKNGKYALDEGDVYAIPCTFVGGSKDYDVSVLKMKTEDVIKVNPQAKTVKIAESYHVADEVYAVGNYSGVGISVTRGIVSVYREDINLTVGGTTQTYQSMRTDAALTHGSSGGGLFNAAGELVGLNHAGDNVVDSNNEVIIALNFSIPATVARSVAEAVMYYSHMDGTLYKGLLGVTVQFKNLRVICDESTDYKCELREDITVNEVSTAGGLADRAGLAVGDIITSVTVNGTKYAVNNDYDLSDVLLLFREGDTVKMGYRRGTELLESEALSVYSANLKSYD